MEGRGRRLEVRDGRESCLVVWSKSWKWELTAQMEMGGTDGRSGPGEYPGYGEKV